MAENGSKRLFGFGRARPSPCSSSESSISSAERSVTSDDDNEDEEEILGAALRGAGGYVVLKTIPKTVTQTSGAVGTPVQLLTNYFKLLLPNDSYVYQYHVTFEPNVDSPRMREILVRQHQNLFRNAYLFDGYSNLKSLTRLNASETVVTSSRTTDNQTIEITISYSGEINFEHLEMLRLYNTQMRRNLRHLQFVPVGRHYFASGSRVKIQQHKLQVWEGMLTAMNEHEGGILMVCDTIFKVLRTDTVRDSLLDVKKRRNSFQDEARKELGGRIVMTSYNNKLYKIDDIDFYKNPTYTFTRRNDEISIIDYYREQYNVEIEDHAQPLIQCLPNERQKRSGITEPILLVPELCVMTGLSESLANNRQVKQDLTNLTRVEPEMRVKNLKEFNRNLQTNTKVRQDMNAWNIKFDSNLVELTAKVLPSEQLNKSITFEQKKGDFSKEIRGKSMPTPVQFKEWGIIVPLTEKCIADDFLLTLRKVCEPLGVKIHKPPMIHFLKDSAISSFVNACKIVPKTYKIIVIIVPNNNEDRYNAIKRILCIDNPIHSQVIVARTLSKRQMLMSVCTKIGIQMAVKIGAEPWNLNIPPKSLMVVGYSTYRDSVRRREFVGGFVCSLNKNLSRYFSRTSHNKNREEMSNNFAANLGLGIQRYYSQNGALPDKVLIYRDGVSEGQIPHVYKTELKKIRDAIRNIDSNRTIKLTFIIVTKRVNARFFVREQQSKFRNPDPGTVVDTIVTRKKRYDFYMVSHSVRQGTVSPTMYNIIADESNWKPHQHHQLAYKLCHLYYNWAGTISVPAPCQYAHKLAYLTGTSLHREAHFSLCESLYFL
ncbi:piwi-like protein 1 [Leptotrombidium deliense]|uniref:Piwi-like protein 1 n=1 Tax=Leptotrombidium deliense TaxID=299467 RepID=A0A443SD11_9ACAR|nr:piwi-like protein 1 [Leptotrombidium deliense]